MIETKILTLVDIRELNSTFMFFTQYKTAFSDGKQKYYFTNIQNDDDWITKLEQEYNRVGQGFLRGIDKFVGKQFEIVFEDDKIISAVLVNEKDKEELLFSSVERNCFTFDKK